jgi:hypothetical protein
MRPSDPNSKVRYLWTVLSTVSTVRELLLLKDLESHVYIPRYRNYCLFDISHQARRRRDAGPGARVQEVGDVTRSRTTLHHQSVIHCDSSMRGMVSLSGL